MRFYSVKNILVLGNGLFRRRKVIHRKRIFHPLKMRKSRLLNSNSELCATQVDSIMSINSSLKSIIDVERQTSEPWENGVSHLTPSSPTPSCLRGDLFLLRKWSRFFLSVQLKRVRRKSPMFWGLMSWKRLLDFCTCEECCLWISRMSMIRFFKSSARLFFQEHDVKSQVLQYYGKLRLW